MTARVRPATIIPTMTTHESRLTPAAPDESLSRERFRRDVHDRNGGDSSYPMVLAAKRAAGVHEPTGRTWLRWPSCGASRLSQVGPPAARLRPHLGQARWARRDQIATEDPVRPVEGRVSCPRYGGEVPRLAAFYGIVIYMYIRDHGLAHFHAHYGEDEAVIEVATGKLVAGGLPRRQMRMVREWTELHRRELLTAWQRASMGEPPGTIEPLP